MPQHIEIGLGDPVRIERAVGSVCWIWTPSTAHAAIDHEMRDVDAFRSELARGADRVASITAFVRVAESGGFTAAARRLDLSTTVRDQVQALEAALGVRLLNRTTRHVSLTEIGREYYERCSQILHELQEADEVASALQVTPRGRLRGQVGC